MINCDLKIFNFEIYLLQENPISSRMCYYKINKKREYKEISFLLAMVPETFQFKLF